MVYRTMSRLNVEWYERTEPAITFTGEHESDETTLSHLNEINHRPRLHGYPVDCAEQ